MENPVNDLFDGWPWLHLNLAHKTTQMAHWLRCGTRIELYVDFAIHPLFTVINNSLQQQHINLLVFVRRSGWRPIPVQSSPPVPPATKGFFQVNLSGLLTHLQMVNTNSSRNRNGNDRPGSFALALVAKLQMSDPILQALIDQDFIPVPLTLSSIQSLYGRSKGLGG